MHGNFRSVAQVARVRACPSRVSPASTPTSLRIHDSEQLPRRTEVQTQLLSDEAATNTCTFCEGFHRRNVTATREHTYLRVNASTDGKRT